MKIATLNIATFLVYMDMCRGHLFLLEPFSRQYTKTAIFEGNSGSTEYCPHCFQARGVAAVRERAERNTNPLWLESYGGGQWPLKYLYDDGMIAENGNYLEPQEISVRHGVCGDPSQGAPEGDNRYGIANSNFQVVENYAEGSVIEIKTMTSTYHWGHLEYFICNAKDLDDPDGPVTQECFNKYPLSRSLDDGTASPIDPAHLGRYFLDPPCRASETDQTVRPEGGFSGQVSTMRYVLPAGLTCERCILQMIYYTGNTCHHPGYREFMPTSVPTGCAPTKNDWINPSNFVDCGDNNAYPEEFWNCADISISSGGGGESTPTPSGPSPSPRTMAPTLVPMPTGVYQTKEPTPEIGYCAEPYEQCGGEGWNGTTCCTADHECELMASCYAQCRPVQLVENYNCKEKWQQCGGVYYEGYTCCKEGSSCVIQNEWYSQCK
ncbi:unnamed protein product [Choristocarpus tenellus]